MNKSKTVELLNDYAAACKNTKHFEAAVIALNRAIDLEPDLFPVLWANLGCIYWNLNQFDASEKVLLKAIKLTEKNEVQDASPYSNYALLLSSMKRWKEAEKYFQKAISINPTLLNARWDMACMYLDQGNWKKGLKLYEIRKEFKGDQFYPKLPYPIWNGEDLNDRTLYVQAEQGMGDRMLFSRYLVWLKEKYPRAKILYFCEPSAITLFWEYRDYVDLMPFGVPWPKADYGVYQMSLPYFHGTTPKNVYPDPGLLRKRIEPYAKYCELPQPHYKSLKVGICWSGNPAQDLNLFRSVPFELMLQLAENPYVTLYSLQVGPQAQDIQRLNAGELICDLGPELKDYAKTGQVMMNLDLVITCCTSVAHLAGALNVPTWTMLAYAPYWIWLTDRDDSVWYPNMKLFRQNEPGNWHSVINNIKQELSRVTKGSILNDECSNSNLFGTIHHLESRQG